MCPDNGRLPSRSTASKMNEASILLHSGAACLYCLACCLEMLSRDVFGHLISQFRGNLTRNILNEENKDPLLSEVHINMATTAKVISDGWLRATASYPSPAEFRLKVICCRLLNYNQMGIFPNFKEGSGCRPAKTRQTLLCPLLTYWYFPNIISCLKILTRQASWSKKEFQTLVTWSPYNHVKTRQKIIEYSAFTLSGYTITSILSWVWELFVTP